MGKKNVAPHGYGKDHPGWRGGRARSGGYIRLLLPGHPRADFKGRVSEHIVVVERAMGHYLREPAQVHHVDGNGENNHPSNLVACDNDSYHKLLHKRQRALDACGNANAQRCSICHRYDRQEDFSISSCKRHKSCHAAQQMRRNHANNLGSIGQQRVGK